MPAPEIEALIDAALISASKSYVAGHPGMHDSRGDTYRAINLAIPTGTNTDEQIASEVAAQIIAALHITPDTTVEWMIKPRITVRGQNTLCYSRMSAYL